jgi:hypothetical protein
MLQFHIDGARTAFDHSRSGMVYSDISDTRDFSSAMLI